MTGVAVTVPGVSADTPVTISPGPGDILKLAAHIGALLNAIQNPTIAGASNNLSVTNDTSSGAISPLVTGEVFLHGPSTDYIIANDGGSLYVSDSIAIRDGTQILGTDSVMGFTDGTGVFDPTGTAEDVSRLYEGILGRVPDVAGLQAWTGLVDNSNVPLAEVANDLLASAEFQNKNGTLTDTDFIRLLYANALGQTRTPSQAELNAWTSLLNSTGRAQVAVEISESAEAKNHSLSTAGDNNNAAIYRLYQAVFGRVPDATGEATWVSDLAAGSTLAQVAQGLVGSAEFQQDYASATPTQFITNLYLNALGRTPDQAGLQNWLNAMQAGTSEAAVIASISDSPESRQKTAAATHANWVLLPSTPPTTELLLSGNGGRNITIPGGYDYIVVNESNPDTVTASNAVIVTNSSVNGTFFISGISTLAATGGENSVTATGNYDLSFGPGINSILAAGSGTITTDTTTGVGSTTTITVSGADNSVVQSADSMTVSASGNSAGLTVTGGSGALTFVGDANTATVLGSFGGSTVTAGTGGVVFTANSSTVTGTSDVVSGGGSSSTIFGNAHSNVTFDGSGNLAYTALAGNVTLNAAAATGNVVATLAGGADTVTLGNGNDTVIAGSGSETLDAGSGNNAYEFTLGQTNGVTDFITESAANLANDTFTFTGYTNLPVETTVGTELELTLSDHTRIIFTNISSDAQIGHINIVNPTV
ncbi:MAG TPA: DUF4214 domain-containing protein [Rhodopila sp.]